MLRSMCKMEPGFGLSNIKLIFADQFIQQSLIDNLGISSTCTLRADYWHCMNQVWSAREHFGPTVMATIGKYLNGMMYCTTKEQWDLLYHKALREIGNDLRKVEKLIDIGNNESYYAGYYLKGIEGNLGLNGSTPVEINHASNVAHLGKGASWSLSEHCAHLFKRQQHLYTLEVQQENANYISTIKYKSPFKNQLEKSDLEAKKALTKYAYETFFVPSAKKSLNLNSTIDNGYDFVCWPVNAERSDANITVIDNDKRYPCTTRVKYLVQCQHELLHDGLFQSTKHDTRWYSQKYYEDNVDCKINQIIEAPTNVCIDIVDNDQAQSEDNIIEQYSKNPTTAVTYTDLNKICQNLINL